MFFYQKFIKSLSKINQEVEKKVIFYQKILLLKGKIILFLITFNNWVKNSFNQTFVFSNNFNINFGFTENVFRK